MKLVIPSLDDFKKIICASISEDLYPPKALTRATSVCTTCLSMIRFTCLKTAIEKDIPFVIFGMSPGQAPISTSVFKTNAEMIRRMQSVTFDPLKKYVGDVVNKYCLEDRHFAKKESFPFIINPLAFIHYDEEEIYKRILPLGWQDPKDTDPNSTNCLLNGFANQIHLQKHHYHPYSMEIADLVREGKLSRSIALQRLSDEPDPDMVKQVKTKLGLLA